MERFVVTGGTGHLGNNVIKLLAGQNKKVLALVLPNEDLTPLKNYKIDIAYGDVRDKDFLKANIQKNDIVIHMAGIIDITSKKNDLLYDVNVNGTKNVADVCLEKGVARLVYTSSVHTIDPLKNGEMMSEPTEFDEKKLVGAYAKTKAIATKYILEKTKEGLNAVVVYPSGIIGPGDYKVSDIGQIIIDYVNGRLYAYVKGGYNFVDVRDVAKSVIDAAFIGKSGENYILSGEMVSIKQLIQTLNEKTGKTKLPPKLAVWFIKMFAGLAEFYYKVRKKKPVFTAYSLETLNTNSNFSNEKAKTLLGFNPRPAKESISDALDWFIKYKPEMFKTNNKK